MALGSRMFWHPTQDHVLLEETILLVSQTDDQITSQPSSQDKTQDFWGALLINEKEWREKRRRKCTEAREAGSWVSSRHSTPEELRVRGTEEWWNKHPRTGPPTAGPSLYCSPNVLPLGETRQMCAFFPPVAGSAGAWLSSPR